MCLGERRRWTLADTQKFEDDTIIRMWLEEGLSHPLHLRGLCDWNPHCPYCKEER